MVSGYAQSGHGRNALIYSLCKSRALAVLPTARGCASTVICQSNLEIGKPIIDRNSNCVIFDRHPPRGYNAVLIAYAQKGHYKRVLELLQATDSKRLKPNRDTILSLLRTISGSVPLQFCRAIHKQIIITFGMESDTAVMNTLLHAYGKLGSPEDAYQVFTEMGSRDCVSWNSMIAAYACNGFGPAALRLFFWGMDLEPDRITFLAALNACSSPAHLGDGRKIHDRIVHSRVGLGDVRIGTALLSMYGKCGSLEDARSVFDEMGPRRNVISWNAMISVYSRAGHSKEALNLFQRMQLEGIKPNQVTFFSLLSSCIDSSHLEDARKIHQHIATDEPQIDIAVNNALISMYGKCNSPNDAWEVFHCMNDRDHISWASMIMAYVRNGYAKQALELFRRMKSVGVKPSRASFLSVLAACNSSVFLEDGRALHEDITAHGFEADNAVKNALINMYGKCSSPRDAWVVFDQMHDRAVITWTAMITAYAQNEHGKEALELLRQMEAEGVKPNRITFLTVLSACASLASLKCGRDIHYRIIAKELEQDVSLNNALINVYGKCSRPQDARAVFDKMHQHDVISWTTMIASYVQNGQCRDALKLLQQMGLEDIKPTRVTFLTLLGACIDSTFLETGRAIHKCIVVSSLESDIVVNNALITMYGKCASLMDAWRVFDQMKERNVISWNTMIGSYAQNGHIKEAFGLFRQMSLEKIKPDRVTFLNILDACSHGRLSIYGKQIEECIIANGLKSDIRIMNALINMYGKCGSLKDSCAVFDEMYERDVISWTAILAAHAQNGHGKTALKLFRKMQQEGVHPTETTFLTILGVCADLNLLDEGRAIHKQIAVIGFELGIVVRNALINMYGKCGSLTDARVVFDGMRQRDVISWTSMITGYVHDGKNEEAFELFWQMGLEGFQPDAMTYLSILIACANLASSDSGRALHKHILDSGVEACITDKAVLNALINMYGKCGSMKDAHAIFDGMQNPDLISWNAIIAAYSQNGLSKEAFSLFQQMCCEGVRPDRITFLSILDACSKAGNINKGREFFVFMSRDHNIKPSMDHYVCMIDLLGGVGCLDEAEDIIKNMPIQPDALVWTTLLGAYRIHNDAERGIYVTEQASASNSSNSLPSFFLSNIESNTFGRYWMMQKG